MAGSPASKLSAAPVYGGVQALPPRKIKVIGVPLDLGASRRGVDMGPSAVRVAGLEARLEALGHEVRDGGNISVAIAETKSVGRPERALSEGNHRDLHARGGDGGEGADTKA